MSIQRAKLQVIEMPDSQAYWFLSRMFKQLTDIKHEGSQRCCTDVDKHGAPKCCYQVTNGKDELILTDTEMQAIGLTHDVVSAGVFPIHENGLWRLTVRDKEKVRESLKDGLLSQVIECTSHPTRPVLGDDGRVIGVVVVKDCMAEYAMDELHKRGQRFFHLWEVAVEKFGTKPYYIEGSMEDGKFEVIYGSGARIYVKGEE